MLYFPLFSQLTLPPWAYYIATTRHRGIYYLCQFARSYMQEIWQIPFSMHAPGLEKKSKNQPNALFALHESTKTYN